MLVDLEKTYNKVFGAYIKSIKHMYDEVKMRIRIVKEDSKYFLVEMILH